MNRNPESPVLTAHSTVARPRPSPQDSCLCPVSPSSPRPPIQDESRERKPTARNVLECEGRSESGRPARES